jgi:lon-related putative ATP-dependent protease
MEHHEVAPEKLRKLIDPSKLSLRKVKDIQSLGTIIGQKRAVRALEFGIGNKAFGFNIYVSGIPGTGRSTAVKNFINKKSRDQDTPADWCYVNNFRDAYYPKILKLPAGKATSFREDMQNFIQDVKKTLNRAFEEGEYLNRKENTEKSIEKEKNKLLQSLSKKAGRKGFMLQQTPFGVVPIPLNKKGSPLSTEEFNRLEESEQTKILNRQEEVKQEIKDTLRKARGIEKESNAKLEELDSQVVKNAISPMAEEMEEKYPEEEDVKAYLEEVKADIIRNFSDFLEKDQQQQQGVAFLQPGQPSLKRFEINVFIDNSEMAGAPLVHELNPTYSNLFGVVEKESQMGTLTTDFTLIKSGSLHRANGGYLVIPVLELFKNPYSWDSLKKALINREIKIEDIGEKLGFLSTKSLRPEPIPLNLQIILIGRPEYYHMLYAYDSEFRDLFKIKAEFDTTMELNEENINNYLAFVEKIRKDEALNSFDRSGLAKIIEYGCRLANDRTRLSAQFTKIYDILIEADYHGKLSGKDRITAEDVKTAIEEKEYRSNLIQEKLKEMIEDGTLIIDVNGTQVGQVNGIAVLDLQDFSFGRPSRITSSIGVGSEGILDIERESKLGGKIHTKGIMILSGYLTDHYARNKPISLSARLVFEQSYQEVEGDSASSAELYAMLSSLSDLPIKQGIAVTGSVNQKGEVQAVGGINDKIEGYFEVCNMKGLTGDQGVIIPQSNEKSLMLKEEVLDAVKEGRFHVWSVSHIDEGISILTGVSAGKRGDDGTFEADTVNARVDNRLGELARQIRAFASGGKGRAESD